MIPEILSLGAGVQSSTLALLATHGEVTPMPMCAIFADTQAEPASVYRHLDWLEKQLAFPVHRVTYGNLGHLIGKKPNGKQGYMPIPAWMKGSGGRASLANRSCTRDFKIRPILKKVRSLVGLTRRRSPPTPVVRQWIGISRDEATRMKPSREPWIETRWPLVELGMSRDGCIRWLKDHSYPIPSKSSCTFCPFHDDSHLREMREHDPSAWAEAVAMDRRIRDLWEGRADGGLFLHRSLVPLDQVNLNPKPRQLNLFENECEGVCGV